MLLKTWRRTFRALVHCSIVSFRLKLILYEFFWSEVKMDLIWCDNKIPLYEDFSLRSKWTPNEVFSLRSKWTSFKVFGFMKWFQCFYTLTAPWGKGLKDCFQCFYTLTAPWGKGLKACFKCFYTLTAPWGKGLKDYFKCMFLQYTLTAPEVKG